MKNDAKLYSAVSLLLSLILSILIAVKKILYYSASIDYLVKINNDYSIDLIWAFISTMLSLLPGILLIAYNIIILVGKKYSHKPMVLLVCRVIFLAANFSFEVISFVFSALTFSNTMNDTAEKMLIFHFYSISSIIFAFMSAARQSKNK